MDKRVFLIVLDSFGIGEMPDAADFGDEGSDTLGAIATSDKFNVPKLQSMGMFNIDGVKLTPKADAPL
ncbi:MAG: phosphopentomutase, partial [Oscillospiraceae bacterium]